MAIVDRKRYNKNTGHPNPADIHLLIEVSDSTLSDDRNCKQSVYAAADVKEYWIVNLPGRQLEVHLSPDVEKQEYLQVLKYPEGQTFISPFCGEIIVSKLLPRSLRRGINKPVGSLKIADFSFLKSPHLRMVSKNLISRNEQCFLPPCSYA